LQVIAICRLGLWTSLHNGLTKNTVAGQ
jgi:hypothetical protein